MSYETDIRFEDEKKHPVVVAWMNLVFHKNMELIEDAIIRQALRGAYVPVRRRTGTRSDRDPYLARKIREALDYRLPSEWQTVTGDFYMDFSVEMPAEMSGEIRRLEAQEKHRLCGLVSEGGKSGLVLKMHRPVLAIPVKKTRFGEKYIHTYRLNPLLLEMLPKLLYAVSTLSSRYPDHAIAVREGDCLPTEYIKVGKKFKSLYIEGSPAEFCIRYKTSF